MDHRKIPNLALALVVIASLLVGASGATSAAVPAPEVSGSAFEREAPLQGEITAAPAPPDPMEKYQQKYEKVQEKKDNRVTPAERQAAADRAAAAGFTATQAAAAAPGEAPHYFSHPNYANSPLPEPDVTVTINSTAAVPGTGAEAKAIMIGPLGEILAIVVTAPGSGYLADVSTTVSFTPDLGATADAIVDPTTGAVTDVVVTNGGAGYTIKANTGIRKFVDKLPGLTSAGANGLVTPGGDPLGQYVSVATPDVVTYPGADYYEIAVVEYQEKMHSDLPPTTLRGYKQLNQGTANVYDAVKNPTGCVRPGDPIPNGLSACALVNNTVVPDPAHYLGATIAATKDRPVRILFRNLLPTGAGGDLFIPTDVTVMGSGMGPALNMMVETPDGTTPTCSKSDADGSKPDGCYTENRADLHLHGGTTPWISDGTPHQWITPFGEQPYPDGTGTTENKGVSVAYVPDMWYDASGATIAACAGQTTCAVSGARNKPGEGAQTYYYPNQQSARMLFYHDHAWGITRLNVYAGEAAGYLITDDTEKKLLPPAESATGLDLIPGAADTIPLVIQDKTFVPSPEQLAVSDSTWDNVKWGGLGNLWLPHVYSPAQNPGDSSGVNQYGRWAYGPWFWPPTQNIIYQPLPNPYYCDINGLKADGKTTCNTPCDPNVQWCEPLMMPGTPWNSMGMEAFHDTPIVNGTAYPKLEVAPKAYRFRVLNAASDRFLNLSLYKAVDANGLVCTDPTGAGCTEAPLNPTEVAAALADPTVFPTPLDTMKGPDWIQIGTEGGFLPAPTVFPAQPITWVTDPTVFNAGNVDLHSLLLGPAERADAIVDFSQFAGQTLILYNDAPAAFPARDPRYDYYTGNGDYRDTGGAPSTLPGYGPNIRTVMQIVVAAATADTPVEPYTKLPDLEVAFAHQLDATGKPAGVFESGQHPIIVGQGAYNSAYGTDFVDSGALDGFARITDFSLTFRTLFDWQNSNTMTLPFQPKAIQDEMGEAFDHDYGRMSGNLGLEVPLTGAGVLQNLILYPFVNPTSELIDATNLPKTLDPANPNYEVQPISVATDGTQIWKITHNGVDTHPIHFHLFDVQVLNRVGWDGIIRPPDANELGWKDTVRISPLEDTIVALRPIIPVVPFDLPNSFRPLNPMAPIGSTLVFNSVDENANPTAPIINQMTNFGWEYVWHCHILSHEEMDMMRPIAVALPPKTPVLSGSQTGNGNNKRNVLTWASIANVTGYKVFRSLGSTGPWTDLTPVPVTVATYTDPIGNTTAVYWYQVFAVNKVGYDVVPGYKTVTATSLGSNTVSVPFVALPTEAPSPPNSLTTTVQAGPQVLLTWNDTATTESGFVVGRCTGTGCTSWAAVVTVGPRTGTGSVTYTDVSVTPGTTVRYRIGAQNSVGTSYSAPSGDVLIPTPPAAPTNVQATAARQGGKAARITVTWTDVATETGYRIQTATNATFTANLVTSTVGAGITTFTTGNLARSTNFYVRVLAFNDAGDSAWVNATPSPILTP